MRGISWVDEDSLASQEGLCSMDRHSSPRFLSAAPHVHARGFDTKTATEQNVYTAARECDTLGPVRHVYLNLLKINKVFKG
jgi:hypothetical protein